jgi:autotransporter-associated beta strand protein/T5SS/PEP-CTERM-associated repeat protein
MFSKPLIAKSSFLFFGQFMLILAAIFSLDLQVGNAAYWNVSSGNWLTASNWIGSTMPTSTTDAFFSNGGEAIITTGSAQAKNAYIGKASGTSGTVTLNGPGQLTVSDEILIGLSGTGTFNQTGGSNTTSRLTLAKGTYSLSAGALTVNSTLYLSTNGNLTISGSMTTNNNTYGSGTLDFLHSTGSATMGGVARLNSMNILNSDHASLTLKPNSLLIVAPGFNPATAFHSFVNNGSIDVQITGTPIVIPAGAGFIGTGSLLEHFDCEGYITSSDGYNLSLQLGLSLSGNGIVDLGQGIFAIQDMISGISGGELKTGTQMIGSSTDARFEQSGGTNTTGYKDLSVAYFSGTSGTYALTNGLLTVKANEYVGNSGVGVFDQSGGTNTITGILQLGKNAGSSGTYNLTGGTLVLKSISKGSGDAAFNFGGGTLQASGTFTTTLPMTLTGDGGNANIDTAGFTVTSSGILSGSGGLKKIGSGKMTLNALNSYSGDTVVNGDTLEIAAGIDASGTSLIDVQAGKAVFKTMAVSKEDLDIATAASAIFEVFSGTHQIWQITGSGSTQVDANANLTAASIVQNTLTIGAGGKVVIRPLTGGPMGGAIMPVPEPSAFVLCVSSLILLIIARARKSPIGLAPLK